MADAMALHSLSEYWLSELRGLALCANLRPVAPPSEAQEVAPNAPDMRPAGALPTIGTGAGPNLDTRVQTCCARLHGGPLRSCLQALMPPCSRNLHPEASMSVFPRVCLGVLSRIAAAAPGGVQALHPE